MRNLSLLTVSQCQGRMIDFAAVEHTIHDKHCGLKQKQYHELLLPNPRFDNSGSCSLVDRVDLLVLVFVTSIYNDSLGLSINANLTFR
jgi:hypothetical protein